MKCHLCVNYIEMQTDPATCDYVIVSGATRKEERWDMAENEQILTTERSEKEKLETDAMFKLDHGGKDKEKLRMALPSLSELQEHQAGWKDDFQLNSALRRKFRGEKKAISEEEEKDNEVRRRTGLSIPLLPEKEEDKKLASLLTFQSPDSYDDRQQTKRQQISSRSWFGASSTQSGGAVGNLLQRLGQQGRDLAAAKALGTSPSCSLSLVRRRSEGGISAPDTPSHTSSTTVTSPRRSRPRTLSNPHTADSETAHTHSMAQRLHPPATQLSTERPDMHAQGNTSDAQTPSPGGGVEEVPKVLPGPVGGTARSLVADYSDSDSDPGQ